MRTLWLACLALTLSAQQPQAPRALLNNRQVLDSYQRVIQLMESTTVAVFSRRWSRRARSSWPM